MSRKELYARIMCGEVLVNGSVYKDPGFSVETDADLAFQSRTYVSRGGEKLEHALKIWRIPVQGKVWLDAGASTGGFTHCLLLAGAAAVHAVDVGKNQIDFSLRRDLRVVLREGTNIMKVRGLSPVPHMAVADLSFRSILGAAEHIVNLTSDKILIALIKPQFEVLHPEPGFEGVVRSPLEHKTILLAIIRELATRSLEVRAVLPSPITGRRGNREFFFFITVIGKETYSPEREAFPLKGGDLLEGIF